MYSKNTVSKPKKCKKFQEETRYNENVKKDNSNSDLIKLNKIRSATLLL